MYIRVRVNRVIYVLESLESHPRLIHFLKNGSILGPIFREELQRGTTWEGCRKGLERGGEVPPPPQNCHLSLYNQIEWAYFGLFSFKNLSKSTRSDFILPMVPKSFFSWISIINLIQCVVFADTTSSPTREKGQAYIISLSFFLRSMHMNESVETPMVFVDTYHMGFSESSYRFKGGDCKSMIH